MSELKPCPFCGESDLTTETDDGIYWVICKVCFAEGPYLSIRADETAVDWNTRTSPIDMLDQIEIYRLIKRAKVRTHGDIAKVIWSTVSSVNSRIAAYYAVILK